MSRSPQKYRSASVVFCALALLLLPSFGSPLSAQQDFLRGDYNGNGVVEVIADFYYFQGNWDHATTYRTRLPALLDGTPEIRATDFLPSSRQGQ